MGLLLMMWMPSTAMATPIQLSQQVRVLDALGQPVDGPVQLEVRLYDALTDGSLLHDELFGIVNAQDGFLSVTLGADTEGDPLDHSVFADGPVFVEQWVDGSRVGDRQRLAHVPYAAVALNSLSGGGLGSTPTNAASSCLAIHESDSALPSGSYWLDVTGPTNGYSDAFEAYCDMQSDGGGWTLVLQGIPQAHPDLNLCNADAVGSLDRSQYQVPGPAKFSDAVIQALWDDGSSHELMGLQHVGNWTTNQLKPDLQCILDFNGSWSWDSRVGGDYATLADLDSPTPRCLVGALNGDGTLDEDRDPGTLCGFYMSDAAGSSTSYFILGGGPTYTSACGGTSGLPAGRSWMGSVGNQGCNTTKMFVR